jgi:anionic cell wall polymer biosynthesis LytR-Cps2A-Psr (LCP) family protein
MTQFLAILRVWFSRPVGAALLSAVFPGLGQAAAGQKSRGAIVAIPALSVVGALLLILLFFRGSLFGSAADPAFLTSLLFVDLVALVYHVWAVVDAFLLARKPVADPRRRRQSRAPVGAAAVLGVGLILSSTIVVHAGVASMDLDLQQAINCISANNDQPCWVKDTLAPGQTIPITTDDPGSLVSDDPGTSADTGATPGPAGSFDISKLPNIVTTNDSVNWAADGQLNVLLLGIDSGSGGGRSQGLRPDSMIVLHLDIKSGKAAMIGIPRNTMCVPLPQEIAKHYASAKNGCAGGTWPNMLNWLANDAGWNHPSYYPFFQGSALTYTRAVTATEQAIETLTGLNIDGYVMINLLGLVGLIDALGGIDITVPTQVYDKPCGPAGTWQAKYRVCSAAAVHEGYAIPEDKGLSQKMIDDAKGSNGMQSITYISSNKFDIGFVIKAGKQHMDGDWALAYARTRIYTTDFDRIKRQQLVLKSLRSSLDPCALLPKVPDLINSVGDAMKTDMPLADAGKWAGLAQHILGGNVTTVNLDPATLGVRGSQVYFTPALWAKAKNLVAHSLDNATPASGGGSGGSSGGGFTC